MTCPRLHRTIALYAGGELGPARTRRIEKHLDDCASCRALAEALSADRAKLAELGARGSEDLDLGSIRGAVLAKTVSRRLPLRGLVVPGQVVVATALVALVFVVLAVVLTERGHREPLVANTAGEGPTPAVEEAIETPATATVNPAEPIPEIPVAAETPPDRETPLRVASSEPLRERSAAVPPPAPVEPMLIKILTDDPEVVIYWIVDSKGEKENA